MTTQAQQQAKEILTQLGGNRFAVMTGAKKFIALENGLRMDLPRNASGANRLEITINSLDLYTMKFYRGRLNRETLEYKVTVKAELENIYCDQLRELFTQTTGFYTNL